jgi:hypothetical protein
MRKWIGHRLAANSSVGVCRADIFLAVSLREGRSNQPTTRNSTHLNNRERRAELQAERRVEQRRQRGLQRHCVLGQGCGRWCAGLLLLVVDTSCQLPRECIHRTHGDRFSQRRSKSTPYRCLPSGTRMHAPAWSLLSATATVHVERLSRRPGLTVTPCEPGCHPRGPPLPRSSATLGPSALWRWEATTATTQPPGTTTSGPRPRQPGRQEGRPATCGPR